MSDDLTFNGFSRGPSNGGGRVSRTVLRIFCRFPFVYLAIGNSIAGELSGVLS